jgi:hypothetical protein
MITTFVSVVEPDHTVKAPSDLKVGERVLMMRLPSISALLEDATRRARFAATRREIGEAMRFAPLSSALTDEDIVGLVRKARRGTPDEQT